MSRLSRFLRKLKSSLKSQQPANVSTPQDLQVSAPETRSWKPELFEDQVYQAVVQPGDVVYDVGANAGQLAEVLAWLTGERGLVCAFEPVWPTYMRLCEMLSTRKLSGSTILNFPIGLSSQSQTATIKMPEGHDGLATASAPEAWNELPVLDGLEMKQFRCQFDRLDDFIQNAGLPDPQVLKIDVEGGELHVIEGGEQTIRRAKPVLTMELFAPWQAGFGYGPWSVLQKLIDWGYEVQFACPSGLVSHQPTKDTPFPAEYVKGYNIVALDPNKHVGIAERLAKLRSGSDGILGTPPAPLPNHADSLSRAA